MGASPVDDQIALAERIAAAAHVEQVDKAGRPYLEHVRRVAAAVEGLDRAAAWLHDVVEDTPATADDLLAEGMAPEVVAAVDALTRRDGEEPEVYYARVRSNAIALRVKAADLADNADPARQALLDEETQARLAAKYAKARAALGLELG